MLWTKQYYYFDADQWLRSTTPIPSARRTEQRRATGNGSTWSTTTSSRCRTSGSIPGTPPGTWRSIRSPLATVDPDFAKEQLDLMLREHYLHPNGQIPAYEWNFSDVNPPVHAWATLFLSDWRRRCTGKATSSFSRRRSASCSLNFTWWVNRKDRVRQERVRGRLSGPRQHRRLRPQRAAAHRGLPGAGRRHRLDGLLLPEHARDRRGTCRCRTGLR